MLLFGVDRVQEYRDLLAGRVALLTSPTGRTITNRSTMEVLKECCDLQLLLAPEHGVRGDKPAGVLFTDEIDPESGLTVCSLYTGKSKRLSQETLARFDTLVYDIADVGCRYYTFISTLRYCMEDCAAAGKRLVVLDRPNPLGERLEGGLLQEDTLSFVGGYTLPVCYGLTCGELAQMMNGEMAIGCDLHIVPCSGLTREMTFREWNHYWTMTSLNIPRFETALLYPGTCLLEGTNLSEGRGTSDPFAILGAPFIRAEAFCQAFNDLGCPGITATPVYFTPTTSKHQGQVCGGIHLHIVDEKKLQPVIMGVKLLGLLKQMYPQDFQLLGPGEWKYPFISMLSGHREFENEEWNLEEMLQRYARESEAFRQRKAPYEIYPRQM